MVNIAWVKTDHGRDLHPLADHMTKLRNFTKEENRNFSAFRFSLQLMHEEAFTNFIVRLMISQKNYIQKLHKRASMLQWILGWLSFSLNLFEMGLAKNLID